MTTITERELLEHAKTILLKHHQQQTRYSRAKSAANSTCADFKISKLSEIVESAYMDSIGKETEYMIEEITAHLSKPNPDITETEAKPSQYRRSARIIKKLSERLEGTAEASTPRERASRTRIVNTLAQEARLLFERNSNAPSTH